MNETKQSKNNQDNDKLMGVLSYIGILWIIPFLAAKDSEFAQFHAKQGMVIFTAGVILSVVSVIPFVGWIAGLVGWIGLLILSIMGIMQAVAGKKENLPLIGDFRIIK